MSPPPLPPSSPLLPPACSVLPPCRLEQLKLAPAEAPPTAPPLERLLDQMPSPPTTQPVLGKKTPPPPRRGQCSIVAVETDQTNGGLCVLIARTELYVAVIGFLAPHSRIFSSTSSTKHY